MLALGLQAQNSIYDFSAVDATGKTVPMSEFKGKVLLIVNTATQCGFTPQYKDLQDLYARYHDKGFEILDFPCNQFGEQAPGTIQEIQEFCTRFDVSFRQFDKIDVNGENAHPLFTFLKSQQGFHGFGKDNPQMSEILARILDKTHPDFKETPDIKWNFTKFLVDPNGKVVERFEPTHDMIRVDNAIQKLLK